MAAEIAELQIKITQQGLDEANKRLDQLEKTGRRAESRFSDLAKSVVKFGAIAGAAFSGLVIGLAKIGSDAEETESKFNTVFSSISDDATKAANQLSESFGLSSKAAQQLLSDTGDLLSGFGFSQQATLDLSTQVNQLAVDLASFTNFSGGAQGASEALTKALLGERESVKSLGIAILETDVQAKVLELTQRGLTFETERQAKAYATLLIAQEQSKNAIGDFARTSDGLANQFRILLARFNDFAVSLGKQIIPAATKLVGLLINIINQFKQTESITKFGDVASKAIELVGRAVIGTVKAFSLLESIFSIIRVAFDKVVSGILRGVSILLDKISPLASIFSDDLANSINNLRDEISGLADAAAEEAEVSIVAMDKSLQNLENTFNDLNKAQNVFLKNSDKTTKAAEKLTNATTKKQSGTFGAEPEGQSFPTTTQLERGEIKLEESAISDILPNAFKSLNQGIANLIETNQFSFDALIDLTKGIFDNGIEALLSGKGLDETIGELLKFFAEAFGFFAIITGFLDGIFRALEPIRVLFESLGQAIGDALAAIAKIIKPIADVLQPFFEVAEEILSFIGEIFGLIGELLSGFAKPFISLFRSLITPIKDTLEKILPLLEDIGKILGKVAEAVGAPFEALGGLTSGLGDFVGSTLGSIGKSFGFAGGGISSGFTPGIVTQTTFNTDGSAFAGEAGAEAIIPIPNGVVEAKVTGISFDTSRLEAIQIEANNRLINIERKLREFQIANTSTAVKVQAI